MINLNKRFTMKNFILEEQKSVWAEVDAQVDAQVWDQINNHR